MAQQRDEFLDPSKRSEHSANNHAREAVQGATEQLSRAADNAKEFAAKVADQTREYGERAQEAAKNFKPFVEKSMKDQPMGTLAVAAVVGFVLGALWKR